jgi:glutamine transport system substrate-binding protein
MKRGPLSPNSRIRGLILVAGVALLATSLRAEAPVTLRVGMDTRSPPWVFVPGLAFVKEDQTKAPIVTPDQLRKLEGLDVDVMKALARRLDKTPEVVPTAWPELEKGLLERRYDVILCGWTPNPKTLGSIAATDPYYTWGLLLAVRSADTKIHSFRDLDGHRVGHYRDPVVAQSLYAMGHGTLIPSDDPGSLFDDLKSGALDAVVFDSLYVHWRVANEPAFRVVGEPLNHLGYHVGVLKANATLFRKIQAAVKDLVASVEMADIRRKWEGKP